MNKTEKKTFPAFFFLVLGFCLLRLLPIFTAIERVYHYDELNIGFIASRWLEHPATSLLDYQFDSYGGESLVLGLFSVPFVKLLGLNLLATKLPSFFFALATFGIMLAFIHRFFGSKKAVLAGLLMLFCHPAYVQLSLSGMTGHTEALFFGVAMLYFFYFFLYTSWRGPAIFLSALCGGISFWIYNEGIILFLLCFACWIVLDRRSLASRFLLFFAAGLALGLAPWFLYNSHAEAKGAAFLGSSFETFLFVIRDWKFVLKKILALLFAGIPFSFAHFPVLGIHERVLSTLYFALAYLPLLPSAAGKILETLKTGKDPDKIFPLLLFPVVFLAFFIASPFDIAYTIGYSGYRYLSPLHLFLLPLPALLLTGNPGRRKILLPAILMVGFLGQTALFFQEPFARAKSYSGNSYYQMGTTLRFCLWPKLRTLQDVEKELGQYNASDRAYFLWGIADAAMSAGDRMLLAGSTIDIDQVLPAFSGAPDSYLREWKESLASNSEKSGEILHKELMSPRTTGLGRGFWGDLKLNEIAALEKKIGDMNLSPEDEISVYRGIAVANFRTSWDSNILIDRSFQTLLDHVSPENRRALFWGIGWIANMLYREDRRRALDKLENMPADGKEEALKGFAAFEEKYGIS